jgi:hypothetical protein
MNYQWNVVKMDCYPQAEGENDVVFTVYWTVSAIDGDYSSSAYGSTGIPVDESGSFTPYNQLTKDQVIGWVKTAMGSDAVTSLEENLDKQIQDQINPPVVSPALPWTETVETI